jgi:hypothetical protein
VNRCLVRICLVAATTAFGMRLPADEPPGAPSGADPLVAIEVRADLVAGEPLTGRLVAIDGDALRLVADGGERSIPLAAVRQLVRLGATPAEPPAMQLSTTAGGTLAGDDFTQEGPRGIVRVGSGRIELPIERVRRVAWLATGEREPGWVTAKPERPETDLLVVRREEGEAFVECAVAAVSADHVTVVLDGETIPVKRAKVIGIEWLREDAPAGGTVVRLAGGRLSAGDVRWSAKTFTVDDIRLPPAALVAIDFAAGRSTPLAGLPLEKVSVEPFFGALAAEQPLAAFFAPRTVAAADGGPASVVVRPRTVATWRVPPESRRFRAAVSRAVPREAGAAVEVVIAVDDRERWRRRLGGTAADGQEPVVADLDVAGGRRLTLTVDFVAGDLGCGVRFAAGAFEK